MLEHLFPIGPQAPDLINAVVEIPKTPQMRVKSHLNFGTGEVSPDAKIVDPPIPIYWHYGAIPETLARDKEPLDIIVLCDPHSRNAGDQIAVRPIGVYRVTDGWQTSDDKIVAVPDTPENAHIREISDLPDIETYDKTRTPFAELMKTFSARYRTKDDITYDGFGDSAAAKKIIRADMYRYSCVPTAKTPQDENLFCLNQRVFLPPPPPASTSTTWVGDEIRQDDLPEWCATDEAYGAVFTNVTVKSALKRLGVAKPSTDKLFGVDRETVMQEKLRMAESLRQQGAQVFTISDDEEWLKEAEKHGMVCHKIEHGAFEAENIPSLSAQYMNIVYYQKADGTFVALGMGEGAEEKVKAGMRKMGIMNETDVCEVLVAPEFLIPQPVPSRGEKMTHLTNWTDFGFNIWPDKQNRPHLVMGENIRDIATIKGKTAELDAFLAKCRTHFQGVHVLKLPPGHIYGSPANAIDIGTAIMATDDLSEESRREMESVLGRPVDNSLHLPEHAKMGLPGLRCATLPIDAAVHSLLTEGDPHHHTSHHGKAPSFAEFHDLDGEYHRTIREKLDARRTELGIAHERNDVTKVESREVAVLPASAIKPEYAPPSAHQQTEVERG